MPDDKKDCVRSLEQSGTDADNRAALLRKIKREMETMTPEELERLYAAIALMEIKQGQ